MINKNKKEIQFEQPSDILLLSNKYIIFIMAFIVLGILVLGYFFVLEPKIGSIDVTESENIETEERRKDNDFLLGGLEELEAEYQDILNNRQENLAFLKKIVPQDSQVAEIFLTADRLAAMHDFQLLSIDLGEKQYKSNEISVNQDETIETILVTSGIKSISIRLAISKKVEGNISGEEVYSDFKDYLAELENTVRLLDVQSINFGAIEESQEDKRYIFNLDLITYYQ